MSTKLKKFISYFLITIVLFFTILILLNVWEIVYFEDIMRKVFLSLLALFGSLAVILFIFSVLLNEGDKEENKKD